MSLQSYAADRIPLDATALFILLSCGGIPGYGLTPWLMGVIGARFGLHISLFVVPVYLVLLILCLLLERRYPPAVCFNGEIPKYPRIQRSPKF